jgi:hypothetical protein
VLAATARRSASICRSSVGERPGQPERHEPLHRGTAMFLVVVVTLVGTGVSRFTYARVARPGSRPIDDETA